MEETNKNVFTSATVKELRAVEKAIYKKLDAIVIDEVLMVWADLMDCVDSFLRIHGKDKTKPFGF